MAKCSELSKNITELVMNVAARSDVKDLNGALNIINKDLPELTRESIVNAIVEYSDSQRKVQSDLSRRLSLLKREARFDKKLRDDIKSLNDYIEKGELPLPKVRKKADRSDATTNLVNIRNSLKEKIRNSLPARKKKLAQDIAYLENKIKQVQEHGLQPKVKKPELESDNELDVVILKRDSLRKSLRSMEYNLKPKTLWDKTKNLFNTSRGLIANYDFNALLRQGGFNFISNIIPHPVRTLRQTSEMFKAFASEANARRIEKEVTDPERPYAALKNKAGLEYTSEAGDMTNREETLMAQSLDKFPGIKMFGRSQVAYLNKIRDQSFDVLANTLSKSGEVTLKEAKAIANFVNTSTGRGNLGGLQKYAEGLNTIFFSPRYVASRFQLLIGQPLWGGTWRTRKLIAKEYAKYLIGMSLVYALSNMGGGETEEDRRSSDFGKIRFGNTRLDPLSGLSQVAVLESRVREGEFKSTKTGKAKKADIEEIITRFLRSKLSPLFGTAMDVVTRKRITGEPTTPGSVVAGLTVPLAMRDIYEALIDQGVPRGSALSMLGMLGMGLQTYDSDTTSGRTGVQRAKVRRPR